MTQTNVLQLLIDNGTLSSQDIETAIQKIIDSDGTKEQFAGILSILASRDVSADELASFASSMRKRMKNIDGMSHAIDLCGTGGDGHDTFNISTACMFVVAGAGMPVAKHGNKASSSSSGSADLLEALSAALDYDVQSAINDGANSIFMYAPNFHPAMKTIAPVRKALGIPTIFNLLGPLLNPASAKYQIIGTTSQAKAKLIAEAVARMDHGRVGVICNQDGLDELSTTCANTVYVVHGGNITTETIDPLDYGIPRSTIDQLRGGTAEENASILIDLLGGKESALQHAVVLNAGYALYIAGKSSSLATGIDLARRSIDSGKAKQEMEMFIKSTKEVAYA